MSAAEQKAEQLLFAMRGVALDDDKERFILWASQMWDGMAVEVFCSILELVREAGLLSAVRVAEREGLLIHKDPEDWGWATSSGGSAYTGVPGSSDTRSNDRPVAPDHDGPIL